MKPAKPRMGRPPKPPGVRISLYLPADLAKSLGKRPGPAALAILKAHAENNPKH